jgi:hypothetical protein
VACACADSDLSFFLLILSCVLPSRGDQNMTILASFVAPRQLAFVRPDSMGTTSSVGMGLALANNTVVAVGRGVVAAASPSGRGGWEYGICRLTGPAPPAAAPVVGRRDKRRSKGRPSNRITSGGGDCGGGGGEGRGHDDETITFVIYGRSAAMELPRNWDPTCSPKRRRVG